MPLPALSCSLPPPPAPVLAGGLLASMLLRIFAASSRPLLLTLHKWLYRGLLEDPFEEFFVMKAPGGCASFKQKAKYCA